MNKRSRLTREEWWCIKALANVLSVAALTVTTCLVVVTMHGYGGYGWWTMLGFLVTFSLIGMAVYAEDREKSG